MSAAREWTLPSGCKVRVGDIGPFRGIQWKCPDGAWVDLARTPEDAEALTAVLCVEVKPNLGGGR